MKDETVRRLLNNKIPTHAEISVIFFENCNLNCEFCDMDKKSTLGMSFDEIKEKLPIVFSFIDNLDDGVKSAQVSLQGGELLQDGLIDSGYLTYYAYFLNEVNKYCREKGLTINAIIPTNFLFTRTAEVKKWLRLVNQKMDCGIGPSYDLTGRFIDSRWEKNCIELKEYIYTIGMVATAPTCLEFLKGDYPYFDYLYNNFNIFIDQFTPRETTDHLIPSDDLYLEYLKYMTIHYPKVHPLSSVIENKNDVRMDCVSLRRIVVFPNNATSSCSFQDQQQKSFYTKLDLKSNANLIYTFVKKNNCLTCPYYPRCILRCTVQWDWINRKRSEGCVMKKWIEWIEERELNGFSS